MIAPVDLGQALAFPEVYMEWPAALPVPEHAPRVRRPGRVRREVAAPARVAGRRWPPGPARAAAAPPRPRLLIVDTLSASATRPISTHAGLKSMLKPLNTLAKDTGVAVVLTAHTRKDGQPAGGQALISIPRQVLQITR